jgi:alkanesulfonate monooxygenase SsuD/methylene tetrahydromethanopterin reductase-like flavin-dependent oxidoreductase (luciferase family)
MAAILIGRRCPPGSGFTAEPATRYAARPIINAASECTMKLMWFHLMPYTELPEDFRDANPSVWVDIHSSLFDPKRAHLMYNDFMDELEYAAQVGFDAVCVNEHHSNGYGLMPSPNLIASSLARRTTNTAICVMGNSLALYNPPTRVAEEFAMIDCISGGRLIAGFPVGTPMDTCYAYGTNPSQLRQRYMEAHDLVVRAWTEKDTFAFNGRFNQQRYVNIWPRPVQNPHPPIWVPGGGSVETWHWCAEMDYVYCYLSYYGYKAGRATMDGFWAEMDRLGKPRNPYQAGFLQFIGVGESRQHAMDLYAEAAEYFYGRCLHVDPKWATPPGYTSEGSQRAGIESQVKKAADSNVRGKSTGERFASVAREMEAIVDNGYVIIGSPDEVAEQLREVAVNLNVGHLMLLMQYGNMSKDLTRYNTRMFAEHVMPKLRDIHAGWDDRWWPTPMTQDLRAAVPAFNPGLAAK